MVRKAVTILLAALLTVTVATALFLYSDNQNLRSQMLNLNQEITAFKSANLTTALGVVEIAPFGQSYWGSNGNFSHLWVTGWVFNSGGSMAKKAGLEVVAFDQSDAVLINYTVPISEGGFGAYSTNETFRDIIPYYIYPTPLEFGNVLSQQNVTVRFALFHEGVFTNNTRYQITPIWNNSAT